MRRFKSPEQAQRFLEPFGPLRAHFCPGRHRRSARAHRAILVDRVATWREVTGIAAEQSRPLAVGEHRPGRPWRCHPSLT